MGPAASGYSDTGGVRQLGRLSTACSAPVCLQREGNLPNHHRWSADVCCQASCPEGKAGSSRQARSRVLYEARERPETQPFPDCSSTAVLPPPAMVSRCPASTKFSPRDQCTRSPCSAPALFFPGPTNRAREPEESFHRLITAPQCKHPEQKCHFNVYLNKLANCLCYLLYDFECR